MYYDIICCIFIAIQDVYLLKPNVLYVQLITLCEHSAVAQIELIILFCGWNIK